MRSGVRSIVTLRTAHTVRARRNVILTAVLSRACAQRVIVNSLPPGSFALEAKLNDADNICSRLVTKIQGEISSEPDIMISN
jgi:hypothetical protein